MIRPLSDVEHQALRDHMAQVWDMRPEDYWYPLGDTVRQDVLALEATPFAQADGPQILRAILAARGVRRCYEFREFEGDPAVELTLNEFDPEYTGSEGYWSAEPWDWVVYASHEESITLGGQWLIEAFKRAWPMWRAHLWDCGDPKFVHRST